MGARLRLAEGAIANQALLEHLGIQSNMLARTRGTSRLLWGESHGMVLHVMRGAQRARRGRVEQHHDGQHPAHVAALAGAR